MCKLVTVLALLAAAENSTTNANATHVSEEILVTDVIRFYDQDCWAANCDAEMVSCIAEDQMCQRHFAPLPKMVNMMPGALKPGSVNTLEPVKEDDAGGGPLLGFKSIMWSQLSAPELRVMECAQRNGCTPDLQSVTTDQSLLTQDLTKAAAPPPPSSFLQTGQLEGLVERAKAKLTKLADKSKSMKAALAHLSVSKESVAHVAELHQHKMQMLQEMQAKGVAAVAKEKQYTTQMRAKMAAQMAKLDELAKIQNPDESSFLELDKTKNEIATIKAQMLRHMRHFAGNVIGPTFDAVSHMRAEGW